MLLISFLLFYRPSFSLSRYLAADSEKQRALYMMWQGNLGRKIEFFRSLLSRTALKKPVKSCCFFRRTINVCFWARWNSVEFRPTPLVLQFGLVETGVSGCGNKAYLFFLPDARFLHSDLSRDPLPLQHQLKLDTQSTFSGNTNLLFPTWIKCAGPELCFGD